MWQNRTNSERKRVPVLCVRCHARGQVSCEVCGGRGETILKYDTLGRPEMGRCSACFGSRKMKCRTCAGSGYM